MLVARRPRCGLELERLPGRAVALGWLHAMLAAAAEFDAAIHLVPVDAAAAHRAVERRLRDLTADRLLEIDRGRIGDAGGGRRARGGGHAARPAGPQRGAARCACRSSVAVHGADGAGARHGAEVVRAAAAGAGLRLRHTHLRHGQVAAPRQ